jgi:hypothetical protein
LVSVGDELFEIDAKLELSADPRGQAANQRLVLFDEAPVGRILHGEGVD